MCGATPVLAESQSAPFGLEAPNPAPAVAKAEGEERERATWLAGSVATQQREASRDVYADLSGPEAQELLLESFPRPLAELNADPARALSELEIEKSLGTYGAQIADDEGGDELIESPVPVESATSAESKEPVDLSLERSGGYFVPENPLTDVRLPSSAAGVIHLPGEVAIADLPGAGDSSATRVGDKNLFFAETDTSTDTLLSPVTGGVEVFEQLRSQDSPEELRFGLSLPEGGALRSDGDGGAEVVDSSGELVAAVPAATAIDAQGAEVPVTMTVEGSALVVDVSHRSSDVAYPILLDPEVIEGWWPYNSNANPYWAWQATAAYEGGYGCIVSEACWGAGLYTRSKGSGYSYGAWSYGQFIYTAPGSTAYIKRAIFGPINGSVHNCPDAQPHGYVGVYNVYSGTYAALGVYSPPSVGGAYFDTSYVGGYGTRLAVVGIGAAGSGVALKCGRDFAAGGVLLYEDDPENPTVNSVTGIPSGWVGAMPFTITANTSDAGFGIRKVTIAPEGATIIQDQVGCSGLAGSRCPSSRISPFGLSGSSFDQGEKTARLTAEDATGKFSSSYQWTTKVDRTPPEVTLGGQLALATKEQGPEEQAQGLGDDELRLPTYSLKIEAKDGSNSTPATKRAGVKNIEVFLDDDPAPQPVPWQPQPCSQDSCEMTESYQLKLTDMAGGDHTLRIVATDQIGNASERKIEFAYAPATGIKDEYVMQRFPLPDGSDYEGEAASHGPELTVNITNGNLVFHERDVNVEGFGADLELERFYNSQLPAEDSDEWGSGWTLAQTPELEPADTGGSSALDEASLVDASGAIESDVALPTENGEAKFEPGLRATIVKQGGGYELSDETGESPGSLVFDQSGQAEALHTGAYAKVEFEYKSGKLSGIAVNDPAATSKAPLEAPLIPPPTYQSAFGAGGNANGKFNHPSDVAIDASGNLWVADKYNNRIEEFDSGGTYIRQFGVAGSGNGQLNQPSSLAITATGNIWVADTYNNRIEEFGSKGEYLAKIGSFGSGNGQFSRPEGIAVDPLSGSVWVADTYNGRLQKFNGKGEFLKVVGSHGEGPQEFGAPTGIDTGPGGNVWVADWERDRIDEYDESGDFIRQFGTTGSGAGQFTRADGIAVDPEGRVWAGDGSGDRIEGFNQSGEYITQFGSTGWNAGQLNLSYPIGIATDSQGDIWITDTENNRVGKWRSEEGEEVVPTGDDPSIQVTTTAGLVSRVEGEQAGQNTYGHEGDLLTFHEGPGGKTLYEYDSAGRLNKVMLPNGTTGEIKYDSAYGRVTKVTVDPAGAPVAKSTFFEYSDEPRRTTVTPEGEPVSTYDIGADGSVLKWWNSSQPPDFADLAGSLYAGRETSSPMAIGDQNLLVQAHSEEGVASIQIVADGTQLVDEKICTQNYEVPGTECVNESDEWVTNTADLAPGILALEVIVTDRLGSTASERFWVNIPRTPPPEAEGSAQPNFAEILRFREEYGLDPDLDPVKDELELNDRILDLVGAWQNPQTPLGEVARASAERWGVPLRPVDVAELEYREGYIAHDVPLIEEWAEAHASNSYAGYYIDHRHGGVIHVGFTQNQAAQLTELEQQSSLVAANRIAVYPIQPTSARASLQVTLEAVESALWSNGTLASLVTELGIEESADRVQVGATDVSPTEAILKADFGSSAPISVVYEAEGEPFSGRNHTSGRILAGDRIREDSGFGCTAGFGAREPRTQKSTGELILAEFLLTAGHCGGLGQHFWRAPSENSGDKSKWKSIGAANRTGGALEGQHYETDALAIRLKDPGLVPLEVYRNGEGPRPIGPAGTARHGETLCFSGASSNEKKCGEMIGVRYRKFGTPGRHLFIVTRFAGIAGDSGSPVWSPRTGRSIGTLSGGPNNGTFKDWVTPLVRPRGFSAEKVPGSLNAPGMGSLSLVEGG